MKNNTIPCYVFCNFRSFRDSPVCRQWRWQEFRRNRNGTYSSEPSLGEMIVSFITVLTLLLTLAYICYYLFICWMKITNCCKKVNNNYKDLAVAEPKNDRTWRLVRSIRLVVKAVKKTFTIWVFGSQPERSSAARVRANSKDLESSSKP